MMFFHVGRWSVCFLLVIASCSSYGQTGWNTEFTTLQSVSNNAESSPWPRVALSTNPNLNDSTTLAYPTDVCTSGCQQNCSNCAPSSCAPCKPSCPWYFSAAGLVMGRTGTPRVWTTYENNNNANQLMNTEELESDWRGGAEFHLGRKICCGTWAVDLGYWTIENLTDSASQTHVNDVSSPLLFNDLEFGAGDPVVDYFDSAAEHRLSRRNELQNIEVNLMETCGSCQSSCCPWSCQKIIGLRFFRFDEDLAFSSLDQGGTWGGNGGVDEVTMQDSVDNELFGAQLGCQWLRRIGCHGGFFITPKFGVYNNHITNRFDLRRGDGTAAAPTAFSGVSGSYPVTSSTDTISFLSELNLGLSWQPTCRCTIFGGYRVVVLSGIATADSQIPQYIVDIPEIADIDHLDTLVLQGVFLGGAYSF